MKLIDRVKSFFVQRLDLRDPNGMPDMGARSDSGEKVTGHTALSLSAVWGCTNLLAGTISTLPLMIYREKDGAREVAKDHPLYRILHDSPNYDQTAVDFWDFMAGSIELRGNAYAEKIRGGGGIEGLVPIFADVSVKRLKNGDLEYRWVEDDKQRVLTDRDVLHIRGFGGNPLGGMSTLEFGRNSFGLARSVEKSAATTFKNGLRLSGQLVLPEFIGKEKRDEYYSLLRNEFTGSVNSGKPFIAEGGIKWETLSISPEDAQMLESRRFSVEEICRFFGVPPHMIGHTENSTSWGTGLEQQTLGFQKFTLRRRLERLEQALEKQLLTPADRASGVHIEFSLEGLLRGDSAARSAFYASGLQNGWYTINEVRALENLAPVEGGGIPRMQMQNVPITEAGNDPDA